MTESPWRDVQQKEPSALDPKIEEAFRELTSARGLEILLVTTPGRSCTALLPRLEAVGHSVVIAKSKHQALDNFYRQAFDFVICDQGSAGRCDEFATYLGILDPRQRILIVNFDRPPF